MPPQAVAGSPLVQSVAASRGNAWTLSSAFHSFHQLLNLQGRADVSFSRGGAIQCFDRHADTDASVAIRANERRGDRKKHSCSEISHRGALRGEVGRGRAVARPAARAHVPLQAG